MRQGLLLSAPLAAVLFLGFLRDNVRTLDLGEGPVVRIVQGNVPQEARLDASRHDENIRQYVDTSRTPPAGTPPKLVIWPEAVLPFDPSEREEFRRDVQAMIPRRGPAGHRRLQDPPGRRGRFQQPVLPGAGRSPGSVL